MSMPNDTPGSLVIIGAPRSGTNMLRDVLCRLEGLSTWPCDEINYIWRHGNARWLSDALPPERAVPRVVSFIRRAFERRRRIDGSEVVVEKTCANSLRVPFVDRVLPEARYIFIHRRPVDAVASAMLRWNAPFNLAYTLAKARFVPPMDFPYYGLRFVLNRAHRLLSRKGRLAFWGPRLDDMDRILREHSLAEVCALQWRESVLRSAQTFAEMDQDRVHVVSYEEFVTSPESGLSAICDFLGRSVPNARLEEAVGDVTDRNVGKGHRKASKVEERSVESLAAPAVQALNRLLALRSSDPRPTGPRDLVG